MPEPTQPHAPSSPPTAFEAFIGGFMGPSYRVSLAPDGRLNYEALAAGYRPEVLQTLTPTPEAWKQFWSELDHLGAWNWQPDYKPVGSNFPDGTRWSFEIAWDDRRLQSGGTNAYPPNKEAEPNSTFEVFCQAISHLVDGREFS